MKKQLLVTFVAVGILAVGTLVPPQSFGAAIINLHTMTTLSANGAEIGSFSLAANEVAVPLFAWQTNGNSNATVNGIVFDTTQPANLAITGPATLSGNQNHAATENNYTGSDLQNLMGDHFVTDGASRDAGTVISGLVAGERYIVQYLHNNDIGSATFRRMRMNFFDPFQNSGGFLDVGLGQGYITTSDFISDGGTQSISLDVQDDIRDRAALNGVVLFQIVQIPEPSTYVLGLIGLMGLGLLGRRRRRNRLSHRRMSR